MIGTGQCPFVRLCERDLAGPELSPEEQGQLEAHLTHGCPVCEERIEAQLSGLEPEGDPGLPERAELDRLLDDSMRSAAAELADGQALVLERIRQKVRDEERAQGRLLRRRHLRALFYVTMVAGTLMLFVAYAGTVGAARIQRRAAQRTETATELRALASALSRWSQEHGERLPADLAGLLEAVASGRDPEGRPYYPLQSSRRGPAEYRDGFGHPYRYRSEPGRALLWSVGPDGRDDDGAGDDLSLWIVVRE